MDNINTPSESFFNPEVNPKINSNQQLSPTDQKVPLPTSFNMETTKQLRNVTEQSPDQRITSLPRFAEVFPFIDLRTNKRDIENTLKEIKNGRSISKAEISYALIEHTADKLSKLTEQCKSIENSFDAKIYYDSEMQKMGFKKDHVKLIGSDKTEKTVTAWTKPSSSLMIHTTPFWLINSKIVEPMVNKDLRDENFLLNNNQKLCTSVVNSEEAALFQPEARAGIIMKVPSSNILDTYSSDRLSPTGFSRSKEEVDNMNEKERLDYEASLEQVDSFIQIIQKHNAITSYIEHLGTTLILVILSGEEQLLPENKALLENTLAGLSSLQKEVISDPKNQKFEAKPAILHYVEELIEIYNSYGENYAGVLGEIIFKDSNVDFSHELSNLQETLSEMYAETESWQQANIHPKAHLWEKAISEEQQVFANRLMPIKTLGPTALIDVSKNSTNRFVELNIDTKNTDLCGFMLDAMHLTKSTEGSFLVDLTETNDGIDVGALKQEVAELESALKSTSVKSEIEDIKLNISAIRQELTNNELIKVRSDVSQLLEFCDQNFIPLIITNLD